ncbi:hypothetical protein GLOIN_2v1582181 [Rhizophagus irregularis DAOM 181602=DAOM 197198]|uniref:Uncharacterized protein n=1 Tax=Rhizophagus irregularis (strain DAOM 181602 / DAOM 197198 / MUCL 43194) TaxID=747089 RepID=A0A2P4Q7W3_RHIID|nr:hypothetical protein GLOIN_2v1670004 [Rhizophagus irregularis DAOM 181602=DAOM 197198]XP_025173141.1 hypothetical protein GLOIN_2v1658580 [Rhizophagus irregularis DAOM 181602=DAOM 197198]XP_025180586.1 hypothetical protein GLOIN_2v1582181 [Rhizophagus irregularis DAOM 181602=DAOM 197198]POG65063.1 hypothetical protein GLOIN_2v1670004 [Rhizophagus irregularis DAOM 181602=DAOM 197198]POG66275.1 hypothetical protein GLOIN_2v1658580 [Rhizophagus irregularis DAOM 181602=DAOM 197198]POG73720.1 hy|eukprot:XP_025171929.1 hypothetical protein GLOIN_2v1670004 [Rhizophagus irregularis DAOM 181602=DAOM 197198]
MYPLYYLISFLSTFFLLFPHIYFLVVVQRNMLPILPMTEAFSLLSFLAIKFLLFFYFFRAATLFLLHYSSFFFSSFRRQ